MGILIDDVKFKDLFSKAIEGIKEILNKDSFKGIHMELKKMISILSGQLPEQKTEAIPTCAKLQGKEIATLLDFPLEENKKENEGLSVLNIGEIPHKEEPSKKLFGDLQMKTKESPPVKKEQNVSKIPEGLLDFPIDQPEKQIPTNLLLDTELLHTNNKPTVANIKEDTMFGNSGVKKLSDVPNLKVEMNKPKLIKYEPVIEETNKKEEKYFNFVDDVLK